VKDKLCHVNRVVGDFWMVMGKMVLSKCSWILHATFSISPGFEELTDMN
jgi:hypothetical protein